MIVSVAICTYNGEKYLVEQLDSILDQTHPVQEIIVCDDLSTDNTLQILEKYQNLYPKIFKIFQNETNLRSTKNFEKAISLSSGDYIFLADQDDYWITTKVEKMIDAFKLNPKVEVFCTNGFVMDENSAILENHFVMWDVFGKYVNDQLPFYYFNFLSQKGNFGTGATMAFTKNFKNKMLPIPLLDNLFHDEWIALVAAAEDRIKFINEKLIHYRIHSDQQLGGVAFLENEEKYREIDNYFSKSFTSESFSDLKLRLKNQVNWYNKIFKLIPSTINEQAHQMISSAFNQEYQRNRFKLRNNFKMKNFLLSLTDVLLNKRKLK